LPSSVRTSQCRISRTTCRCTVSKARNASTLRCRTSAAWSMCARPRNAAIAARPDKKRRRAACVSCRVLPFFGAARTLSITGRRGSSVGLTPDDRRGIERSADVELLHAAVHRVRNVEKAAAVDCQRVRDTEATRIAAKAANSAQVATGVGELLHPAVGGAHPNSVLPIDADADGPTDRGGLAVFL